MGRYAFHLHPWFLATGAAGFYVYTAARAYADDLGLSSIPVKAMTTLLPHVPRDVFADTVKALIAAGAFRRLESSIELVSVPGSDVQDPVPDPAQDVDSDDPNEARRRYERDRKARQRAAKAGHVPGRKRDIVRDMSGTMSGTRPGQGSGTDLRNSLTDRKIRKKNPPTPQADVPDMSHGESGTCPGHPAGQTWRSRCEALVQTWNANCGRLPKIRAITSNRERAFRLALEAHPDLADWARGAAFLTTQTWAMGGSDGHQNWFATLDYLAKPGKLAAALEKADALAQGLAPAVTGTKAGRTEVTPGKYAHLND